MIHPGSLGRIGVKAIIYFEVATAVVARWEGVFDEERMRAFGTAGLKAA